MILLTRTVLFTAAIFFSFFSSAHEKTLLSGVEGSLIATGLGLEIEDDYFDEVLANAPSLITNKSNIGVRLHFTDEDREVYTSDWDLTVSYSLILIKSDGGIVNVNNKSITIDYTMSGNYSDISLHEYQNYHSAILIVDGVTLNGLAVVPDDVHLDLEWNVDRFFEVPASSIMANYSTAYLASKNELELEWDFVLGAESYDLEWLFVDEANESFGSFDKSYDFRNAVRVSSLENNYRISMAYPRGVFIFRVRAVGVDLQTGKRKEGAWSLPRTGMLSQVSLLEKFNYDGLHLDMNWNYQATFSEEGKKKEVFGVYDGLFKPRQSITKVNSEDHVLIQDNVYDYLGRASLVVLPSAVQSTGLHFYSDRLKMSDNSYYDYTNFDTDTKYAAPDPIGSDMAVGNYYAQNGSAIGFNSEFVADAEGRPYMRQKYFNDGSGRVKSIDGVGGELSSGHTQKFYYGNPLSQAELDRLFGNEVGYVQHYKKQWATDANGQTTVTYTDQYGRVIATALSGDSPSNMLEIDSKPLTFPTLTGDLESSLVNNTYLSQKSFYNVSSTTYTIDYELVETLIDNPCDKGGPLDENFPNGPTYPIAVQYDLKIYLKDEDNNIVDINLANQSSDIFFFEGITEESSTNFPIVITLPPGGYKLYKELTLDEDFLEQQIQNLNTTGCEIGIQPVNQPCEDCTTACEGYFIEHTPIASTTNNKVDYYDENQILVASTIENVNGGIVNFTVGNQSNINAVLLLIDACEDECENPIDAVETLSACEVKLNGLTRMMLPGGQYFDNQFFGYVNTDPSYDINYWLEDNIGASPSVLDGPTVSQSLSSILTSASWSSLRTDFAGLSQVDQDVLSAILVEYHPEYCFYLNDCYFACYDSETGLLPNSLEYDDYPDDYLDYDGDWYTNGNIDVNEVYLNPSSLIQQSSYTAMDKSTYQPIVKPALGLGDPFFDYKDCSYDTQLDVIQDKLQNFIVDPNTNEAYSIWYVLEDPEDVTGGNTTASQAVQDAFIQLHGNGSTIDGIISETDPTKMTRYDYFRTYYLFIRSHAKYQIQELNCGNHSPQLYGEVTTTEDFRLIYPENYLFENITNLDFSQVVNLDHSNPTSLGNTPAPVQEGVFDATACYCDNFKDFVDFQLGLLGEPTGTNLQSLSTSDQTEIMDVLEDMLLPSEDINNYSISLLNSWYTNTDCSVIEASTVVPLTFSCEDLSDVGELDAQGLADACTEEGVNISEELYQFQLEQVQGFARANFRQSYIQDGFTEVGLDSKETYNISYELKEYHYMLFYYDQAGNLIKTVPPAGIFRHDNGAQQSGHTSILTSTTSPSLADVKTAREDTDPLTYHHPSHQMITNYKYNSLQQMVYSFTPDGGASEFWYDELGRLIVSQNATQKVEDYYSYTIYDELGRAVEVGEKYNTTPMSYTISRDPAQYANWLNLSNSSSGQFREVTRTFYNDYVSSDIANEIGDVETNSLRNRIGSITYKKSGRPISVLTYDHGLHYSYDINGNVKTLLNEDAALAIKGGEHHRYKRINYEYDLVNGNVNQVNYQPNLADEFYHRYYYDADNRVTEVFSSTDGKIWEKESKNFYYATGALARMEIGDKQVQARDMIYTINGWLKAINSTQAKKEYDAGNDALAGNINENFGEDANAFSLEYFDNDYTATNATTSTVISAINHAAYDAESPDLYNGNIAKMITSMTDQSNGELQMLANAYRYDQLNRIKEYNAYESTGTGFFSNNEINAANAANLDNYKSTYTFDGNGNILTLKRNANSGYATGNQQEMDDFMYFYNTRDFTNGTQQINQLNRVNDLIANSGSTAGDIQGSQANDNYAYDEQGRLIQDLAEGISNITWTVDNKVKSITGVGQKSNMEFNYDAMRNRIEKIEYAKNASGGIQLNGSKSTHYVRDAQGNTMAVYETNRISLFTSKIFLTEHTVYGSKRLGVVDKNLDLQIADFDYCVEDNKATSIIQIPNSSNGTTIKLQLSNTTQLTGTKTYPQVVLGSSAPKDIMYQLLADLETNGYSAKAWQYNGVQSGNFYIELKENIPGEFANLTVEVVINGTTNSSLIKRDFGFGDCEYARVLGNKNYELSNHLGNVLNTISDRKLIVDDNNDQTLDYYTAQVTTFSDYYPYGMQMPGRKGSTGDYRYGFQGQEKDDEVKGEGNSVNYKYRMHDPRVGRFFAVDPLAPEYPELTPYQFSSNRVIDFIEIEGLEGHHYKYKGVYESGKPVLELMYVDNRYTGKIRLFLHHDDKKTFYTFPDGFYTVEYDESLEVAGDNIEKGDFSVAFSNVDIKWFRNTLEDKKARRGDVVKQLDASIDLAVMTTALARTTARTSFKPRKTKTFGEVKVFGKINGNSKKSKNAQHGYEIFNKLTGEVVKVGISGGKISKNGLSYRAQKQVRKWNREEGDVFESRIVYQTGGGEGARVRALKWEAGNASFWRAEGHLRDPKKHSKP